VTARSQTLFKLTSKRGTTAIEYAIILPAFLLCVLGILDIGRLFWTTATLQRAVASAARCAGIASPDCTTTTQIKVKAVDEAWGVSLGPQAINVAKQACGMRVTATYAFAFSVPGFSPITLTSSTCYATNP
jgi:Flp pilus assembly protein TadG